ncbi:hypothetical protein Pcinc_008421 [Petrolisthes cinctipes]|uniref:Uncharacterized protein n=1 Tax=Petrolisthes cinctipes TaxID=88211 RepID=A0AAE1G914_PETCI|nr:hypothetical protein Pcinc_008421 [Petrolisthes cinctipes]
MLLTSLLPLLTLTPIYTPADYLLYVLLPLLHYSFPSSLPAFFHFLLFPLPPLLLPLFSTSFLPLPSLPSSSFTPSSPLFFHFLLHFFLSSLPPFFHFLLHSFLTSFLPLPLFPTSPPFFHFLLHSFLTSFLPLPPIPPFFHSILFLLSPLLHHSFLSSLHLSSPLPHHLLHFFLPPPSSYSHPLHLLPLHPLHLLPIPHPTSILSTSSSSHPNLILSPTSSSTSSHSLLPPTSSSTFSHSIYLPLHHSLPPCLHAYFPSCHTLKAPR